MTFFEDHGLLVEVGKQREPNQNHHVLEAYEEHLAQHENDLLMSDSWLIQVVIDLNELKVVEQQRIQGVGIGVKLRVHGTERNMESLCPSQNYYEAAQEEPKHAWSCSAQGVDDSTAWSKEGVVSQKLKHSERKEEATESQEDAVDILDLSNVGEVFVSCSIVKANALTTLHDDFDVLCQDHYQQEYEVDDLQEVRDSTDAQRELKEYLDCIQHKMQEDDSVEDQVPCGFYV